jgi:serine/threonine protein kinase
LDHDHDFSEEALDSFLKEIAIMRRVHHPNIVQFLGACSQGTRPCIVTQFVPRGSLFKLLHQSPPGAPRPDARRRLQMALDAARGMHFLHTCRPPILHRDLKSPNLLVDRDLTIKICDFNLSLQIGASGWAGARTQAGTPEWTAPEVLRAEGWSEQSDIYSFGVILWELQTGEEPWADRSPLQVVRAVGWNGERLPIPEDAPEDVQNLIKACFGDAGQRPSFTEIIKELKAALRSL